MAEIFVTEREKQLLQLIAQGCVAEEMATVLHISPRTIEVHISRLKSKVDAKNKAHLIAIAYEQGHLSPKNTVRQTYFQARTALEAEHRKMEREKEIEEMIQDRIEAIRLTFLNFEMDFFKLILAKITDNATTNLNDTHEKFSIGQFPIGNAAADKL